MGPLGSKLRPATLDSSSQHCGGGLREASVGPGGTHSGPLNESKVTSVCGIECRAAYGRQGQRPSQQDIEHVLFPAGALKISGKRGERTEPTAKIIQHQQQDSSSHGQGEQDIEVVAPGDPASSGAKERIIEVVEPPEAECHGKEGGSTRAHPTAITEEDPAGAEGRETEEQHSRTGRPQEVLEPIDGNVGPERGEKHDRKKPGTPANLLGEKQSCVQQCQSRPAGQDLMPVEPDSLRREQEAADRADPQEVQSPCG